MASRVRVRRDFSIQKIVEGALEDGDLEFLFNRHIIEPLKKRTQQGFDRRRHRFKPYTEKYAKSKGVGRRSVDLTKSGSMLGDIDIQLRPNQFGAKRIWRIGFSTNAMAERAEQNSRQGREFRGVQDNWIRALRKDIEKAIVLRRRHRARARR